MDVQNISGTDIISSNINVNPRISNENTRIEKQDVAETEKIRDNTKGNNIDIKA